MASIAARNTTPMAMRLTAQAVLETQLPAARIGGVNTEAVASFTRAVAEEIATLTTERDTYYQEAAMLGREVEALRSAPSPAQVFAPEKQAVAILRRAQANADHLVADGQEQARRMVEDAARRRADLLADGRERASRLISEAVEEAGREAARIAAQAPVDAQRQLAYYRSLADTVRTALAANLQALQAQVDRWENEERSAALSLPMT